MVELQDIRSNLRNSRETPVTSAWSRFVRAARSALFALVYSAYLMLGMAVPQRIILQPMVWLFPRTGARFMAPWVRWQARNTLWLLRIVAGVGVSVDGAIAPASCIAVMNHQSLADIPLAFALVPGPMPLIPTRRRHARGVPGVSVFLRMARFPLVSQSRKDRRADLDTIAAAAAKVQGGEASLVIFPEGHRTRDGEIQNFMPSGLRVALTGNTRPVYCIVADGFWRMRTWTRTMADAGGVRVSVRILGPFTSPPEADAIPAFVDSLRERMVATLRHIRLENSGDQTETSADAR